VNRVTREPVNRVADKHAEGPGARRFTQLGERWPLPQFFAAVPVAIGEAIIQQPVMVKCPALAAGLLGVERAFIAIVLQDRAHTCVRRRDTREWCRLNPPTHTALHATLE
jgi:hypothetical protein